MKKSIFIVAFFLSFLTKPCLSQIPVILGKSFSATSTTPAIAAPNPTPASWSAAGGALTFPFKFRLQKGAPVEPSLSLSAVAGPSYSFIGNNFSLSFLVGVGPSSININNKNSSDTSTSASTRNAATFSGTLLAQLNKVQLAVSIGIDKNLDNSTDNWIYQSKPWLSLGIGFNIFSSQ